MSPNVSILAVRIRAELSEIHPVVEGAQHLLAKAIASDDDDYDDGVALNLHSFYTAIDH